jgi:hypothetical protein
MIVGAGLADQSSGIPKIDRQNPPVPDSAIGGATLIYRIDRKSSHRQRLQQSLNQIRETSLDGGMDDFTIANIQSLSKAFVFFQRG